MLCVSTYETVACSEILFVYFNMQSSGCFRGSCIAQIRSSLVRCLTKRMCNYIFYVRHVQQVIVTNRMLTTGG